MIIRLGDASLQDAVHSLMEHGESPTFSGDGELMCACMQPLAAEDIENGQHKCGRIVTLSLTWPVEGKPKEETYEG